MARDRWLPLSARDDPERAAAFDILHEGVPDWLLDPMQQWVEGILPTSPSLEDMVSGVLSVWERVRPDMQAKLRAKIPANGPKFISGDLCLDVVDYILQYRSIPAEELSALECRLEDGGSAWRATSRGLERRVDATLQNAAESVFETETRPAQHLRDAWQKAWGRSPDASAAYTNAVRAVEAAYAPIVSPKNGQATLGSIIADIKNKPSKFEVRLQEDTPGANVDRLIGVLQMLWKSQLDRHGTADESVPLNVSIDEARDAVALATTLVHLAQQGGFSANGN